MQQNWKEWKNTENNALIKKLNNALILKGLKSTMACLNENGEKISFECSELIEELKEDIAEFGGETIVAAWCEKCKGVEIYTNYDFFEEESPVEESELKDGEYIKQMTMTALLILLEKQNDIF